MSAESRPDPLAAHPASADPLLVDPLLVDPLTGDPRVRDYFGQQYESVAAFTAMLAVAGVERGLVGPREVPRLWERHILNSAALVPFLPTGAVADVGSGAGLPGLVIALMQRDRAVTLIESMERRVAWLTEVVGALGLVNVTVVRARAEDLAGSLTVPVITARAVAPVAKLVRWCAPLLAANGEMLLLKGKSAEDEVREARPHLQRARLRAEIHEAHTIVGLEPTMVVRLSR